MDSSKCLIGGGVICKNIGPGQSCIIQRKYTQIKQVNKYIDWMNEW
jgi:hypothetical protein